MSAIGEATINSAGQPAIPLPELKNVAAEGRSIEDVLMELSLADPNTIPPLKLKR